MPAPGKSTTTGRLPGSGEPGGDALHPLAVPTPGAVQLQARGAPVEDPFALHTLAQRGVAGPAQELPHRDAIQHSFGHHDVSGVRAHVGGPAADAADAMGASAFATGNDVAFAAPPDLRLAAHEAAHVVQQASGVHLDGGGTGSPELERHADAIADRTVRGESAAALLDAAPGRGGGGPASELQRFADAFNAEFAAQLHAFDDGSSEAAAERGPDVSAAELAHASGPPVPAARLQRLFTSTQRQKLSSFIATRIIPERLFNGDDVGTTTAQQRILLAGHILSTGRYQPGSFEQAVHARMCGHWVNLVMHYAGAAEGAGAGVREEFDHTGALSMSVSESTGEDGTTTVAGHHRDSLGGELGVGRRREAAEGARAQFELQGLPFENFALIQPGDWLWVYNDNGSPGGNHSIVFSRWASGELSFQGVRYRRAITMSQISPDAGGREETRILGERFIDTGNGRVTPVTHISRADAGARPMQTAADLIAILGSGDEAAANHQFIEQRLRGRGTFDWDALVEHLRGRNAAMIEQLRPRMTDHQHTAFTETNRPTPTGPGAGDGEAAAAAPGGEALVPRLVRLHERLTILVANAAALGRGTEAQREGIEGRRDARLEDTREARERVQARITALEAELEDLEAQHRPLAERVEADAAHAGELRTRYVERRRLRERRRELRDELRNSSLGADERTGISDELEQLGARLDELAPEIARLEEEEGDRAAAAERREARRAARAVEVQINQRTRRLTEAQRELGRYMASAGYYTAHGRVSRDEFNGRGEARRATGLLRNLSPAPDWGQFIRTGAVASEGSARGE